jgi:hypothetical protein
MSRILKSAGIPAFLLGAGLQIAGWTNPVVGVFLMVLGGVWTLSAFAGPPLVDRALDAVSARVAQRLQVGQSATLEKQEADRKRWLRAVTQRMLAELVVAQERLEEARKRGAYWDSDVTSLASDEWDANHREVSDQPEFDAGYMDVRLAFEELNRVNAIAVARWRHQLYASRSTDASDRLEDAIARVGAGISRLEEINASP